MKVSESNKIISFPLFNAFLLPMLILSLLNHVTQTVKEHSFSLLNAYISSFSASKEFVGTLVSNFQSSYHLSESLKSAY